MKPKTLRLKVVVLGCGPAGLFAAHAAVTAGHEVAIISKKRKSHLYGAQYLHAPIAGLTDDRAAFVVDYSLRGTAESYASKVYGEVPPDFVSPQKLLGRHKGWDIRHAYNRAWSMYEDLIEDRTIFHRDLVDLALASSRDVVISTIPLPDLCMLPDAHFFTARKAWAIGDAPDRKQFAPKLALHNSVICNGSEDGSWYRASNILGHSTVEWPQEVKPPIEGVVEVTKAISTNCDCFRTSAMPQFWRAGRYGTWMKGHFSHHAYYNITSALTLASVR